MGSDLWALMGKGRGRVQPHGMSPACRLDPLGKSHSGKADSERHAQEDSRRNCTRPTHVSGPGSAVVARTAYRPGSRATLR